MRATWRGEGPGGAAAGRQAGVVVILPEPFDLQELQGTVARALWGAPASAVLDRPVRAERLMDPPGAGPPPLPPLPPYPPETRRPGRPGPPRWRPWRRCCGRGSPMSS